MSLYDERRIPATTKVRYSGFCERSILTTMNLVPFLPVRDDFHPKRNQARQKLATLPTGRFKDLSSDVYYELGRRYPEFKEDVRLSDGSLSTQQSLTETCCSHLMAPRSLLDPPTRTIRPAMARMAPRP